MEIEQPTGPPTESARPSAHPVLEELLELGTVEERTKELLLAFEEPPDLEPKDKKHAVPRQSATEGFNSPYRLLVSENEVRCLTTPGAIITNIINPAIFSGDVLMTNELKLFVREEYVRLYENMMARKSLRCVRHRNFRCLLTGNAGTGKTMFLIYFMMRVMCENRGNPKFRMVIVVEGTKSSWSLHAFTRKSGWFEISDKLFYEFRMQADLDPDCWIFADSVDIWGCGPNALVTASPNPEYYKHYAKENTATLYMPLWNLNELIYVFRKIINPSFLGDSGEASAAAPIVFLSDDPASGWKEFLNERENCKNPLESLPLGMIESKYHLGGEAERGLNENKVIRRFLVWGGVPRTVFSLNTLPDMWQFILGNGSLTDQVLGRLSRGIGPSTTFSMKQEDAEHRVVTYVIEMTDDVLTRYNWRGQIMFTAISEYARFLMGEKYKQRSLFDAFSLKETGGRQEEAAFERLGRKYLAGNGGALLEENTRLKRAIAESTQSDDEKQLRTRALIEENTRLKRTIVDWERTRRGLRCLCPTKRVQAVRSLTR